MVLFIPRKYWKYYKWIMHHKVSNNSIKFSYYESNFFINYTIFKNEKKNILRLKYLFCPLVPILLKKNLFSSLNFLNLFKLEIKFIVSSARIIFNVSNYQFTWLTNILSELYQYIWYHLNWVLYLDRICCFSLQRVRIISSIQPIFASFNAQFSWQRVC